MSKNVIIDREVCKGCALCVNACPKKVLNIDKRYVNKKGYYPAEITDIEGCISCAICGIICPDSAITVEK